MIDVRRIPVDGLTLGEAAQAYAALGFRVFPLWPGQKKPITASGFKDASTDPDQIRRWWAQWETANIGLVLPAGLFAVDVDPPDGESSLAAWEAEHGKLPDTLEARTPRGGRHLYFLGEARQSTGVRPGIDVRAGDGKGYLVAPPSVGAQGVYQWSRRPDVAPAPEWLTRALVAPKVKEQQVRTDEISDPIAYARTALDALVDNVATAPEGERHAALYRAAARAGALVATAALDWGDAERELTAAGHAAEQGDAHRVVRDGMTQGAKTPDHALVLAMARNHPSAPQAPRERPAPPPPPVEGVALSDLLPAALARLQRRHEQLERPIPTPWPVLNHAIGGGLWPGCYAVVGTPGAGKSQLALQVALSAAAAGHHTVYAGLELGPLDCTARVLGILAQETGVRAPWSDLYLGRGPTSPMAVAAAVAGQVASLGRLRFDLADPYQWNADRIVDLARAARERANLEGGERQPVLLVLDFLQIIGKSDSNGDLRERIGAASYAARAAAVAYDAAVLLVSATARGNYDKLIPEADGDPSATITDLEGALARSAASALSRALKENPDASPQTLASAAAAAALKRAQRKAPTPPPWERGAEGAAALIGLAKESGEVEYSADAVMVMVRHPAPKGPTEDTTGRVHVAIAKGRAFPPTWVDLWFDGCTLHDRGGK